MTQTLSIKETREKLADVVNQVAVGGDTFVITKFGQPKAMIVPLPEGQLEEFGLEESFGAWSQRKDLQDSNKWAANLRTKMSRRDE